MLVRPPGLEPGTRDLKARCVAYPTLSIGLVTRSANLSNVLHLLVDTSTWLDLAKRRDGQRWIVAMRLLVHQGDLQLLVPEVVIDEFERNRDRVETTMTTTVAQRFKLMKQDLGEYGGRDYEQALGVIEGLALEVPLIGAMTTRNFNEVRDLLRNGKLLEPTDDQRSRVVQRGLDKRAPFHRSRNSVADALLIELYATAVGGVDLAQDPHAFVTTNSDDFSLPNGDQREPHPDLAVLFAPDGSSYGLGVDGLNAILLAQMVNARTEDPVRRIRAKKRPSEGTPETDAERALVETAVDVVLRAGRSPQLIPRATIDGPPPIRFGPAPSVASLVESSSATGSFRRLQAEQSQAIETR